MEELEEDWLLLRCEEPDCPEQAIYGLMRGRELVRRVCHEHYQAWWEQHDEFWKLVEESYSRAELEG